MSCLIHIWKEPSALVFCHSVNAWLLHQVSQNENRTSQTTTGKRFWTHQHISSTLPGVINAGKLVISFIIQVQCMQKQEILSHIINNVIKKVLWFVITGHFFEQQLDFSKILPFSILRDISYMSISHSRMYYYYYNYLLLLLITEQSLKNKKYFSNISLLLVLFALIYSNKINALS